jgi:hypothetical protein
MNRFLVILVLVCCLWAARDWSQRDIPHPAGWVVPELPRQTEPGDQQAIVQGDFVLKPRALFEIRARVLSVEPYYMGVEAGLSPIDLALGWGVMSDQAVLDRIEITQGNRWYFTHYDLPAPVPEAEIIRHSGNMHIIPANAGIAREAKDLRVGDIINLRGSLVDVDRSDGWRWRTSLSRDDTGAGSCEVFFVEFILREVRT